MFQVEVSILGGQVALLLQNHSETVLSILLLCHPLSIVSWWKLGLHGFLLVEMERNTKS